jgi:hypothetical protein
MDPARIFTESLTPRPELENSLGEARAFKEMSVKEHLGIKVP